MNAPLPEERAAARFATLLLIVCTVLALANLPSDDLPLGWLIAFTLPGGLLALLGSVARRPWQRALLAVVLQTAACLLALHYVGPMSRPAALACTILPPLGFATVRSQAADQALALFLAFCVLLVGVILDGIHVGRIAGFCVAGCLALRCANRLTALGTGRFVRLGGGRERARDNQGGTLPLAVGCLLAVLLVDRTLEWLPSPSRRAEVGDGTGAASPGQRRAGLDDAFVLDGSRGLLAELSGEQLVHAASADRQPVPTDLYLRSGFFTVPGLDRWQLGALETTPPTSDDGHVLRSAWPDAPLRRLELERSAGARNFVFVPPHTCQVLGLPQLVVDNGREWIRQRRANDTGPYEVVWQDAPALDMNATVGRVRGLLDVPRDFDRARCEALLQQWNVGREPVPAMERIAAGLARHCRYDRVEPAGPFGNAIENFLFADGDRRGYCMHFASAAALLLRLRGIPCRIGVGLHGGDADKQNGGTRVFGSQHAHAWVEVPFADRGYCVFDPTPPSERGQRMPQRLDPGGDDAANTPKPAAPPVDWQTALLAWLTEPWLLALLLALALAASTWPKRVAAGNDPLAPATTRSARRLLARLLHALAAAGHPRQRGQTLELFARDLTRVGCLQPAVAAAFATYQQVRFGGRPFDPDREQQLRAGIDAALAMPRHELAPTPPPPPSPARS
jgi:hypothetical protein